MSTHHKPVGDLGGDHTEGHDVERRVVLVHVGLTLLEDDERRDHHQRERDHRRQDTRALRIPTGCTTVFGGTCGTVLDKLSANTSKPRGIHIIT